MNTINKDIRWVQRFNNFKKALASLKKFLDQRVTPLNDLEEQGLIQAFEYTYELGWNTLRDFYLEQGEENIQGSRDAIQMAFKRGLIEDGQGWLNMLQDRNQSTHTYNEATADRIVANITGSYFQLFLDLEKKLNSLQSNIP